MICYRKLVLIFKVSGIENSLKETQQTIYPYQTTHWGSFVDTCNQEGISNRRRLSVIPSGCLCQSESLYLQGAAYDDSEEPALNNAAILGLQSHLEMRSYQF